MKLSEAIRAGAKIGPQAYGQLTRQRRKWFFGLIGPAVKELCALGAAFEAGECGSHQELAKAPDKTFRGQVKQGELMTIMEVPPEWMQILFTSAPCPQCGEANILKLLIPHMNDDHRWTREEIALFVERVEQCRPAPQLAPMINSEVEWPEVIG